MSRTDDTGTGSGSTPRTGTGSRSDADTGPETVAAPVGEATETPTRDLAWSQTDFARRTRPSPPAQAPDADRAHTGTTPGTRATDAQRTGARRAGEHTTGEQGTGSQRTAENTLAARPKTGERTAQRSLLAKLTGRDRLGRPRRVRRATVDTTTPPPSPLQPIDLTDDTAVTEVLRLAIWVGVVLMASGTGAIDTQIQVRQVASAYGLAECDVDVTFNSIAISARRGSTLPPAGAIRIVEHRSHDFSRLAAIDRLVRRIRVGAVSPKEAAQELEEITNSPHPYPRWVSTVAWAGMAGSIALLLGAGLIVATVALLCTMVIYQSNLVLNKVGLPYFFQQIVGGFIATIPAAALYSARDTLGLDMRPSLVIASGIVVLLSGLSLVGSVQDAITGAPITASARFFEVLMMTAGIIVGVAIGLRLADAVGLTLPPISAAQYSGDLARLPVQVVAGAFAAGFFALACYAERRAVAVAATAGAGGALVYSLLSYWAAGPIIAAGTAATVVGIAGGLLARRALTPPIIVGIAGITPLLPGLSVYRSLYSFLSNEPLTGFSSLATVMGIGSSLAAGVVLGEWAARTIRKPRIVRASALPKPIVRRIAREPDNGREHTEPKWRNRRSVS